MIHARGPAHGNTRTDPPDWLEEARELYASGLSLAAVGERVYASSGTVGSWLARSGVTIRRPGRIRRRP